jgi:uncharacterized protein YbjQ (UPF0145 family)
MNGGFTMKKYSYFLLLSILAVSSASALDARNMFSIKDAMASSAAKEKLNQGIKFYFGNQKSPQAAKNFGEFTANKKTNAFNKSDSEACEWAFLSALVSLQDRAKQEGGNAVVNIKSYYKKNEISSNTEYECGAGKMVAGVTLKGEVVKLGN